MKMVMIKKVVNVPTRPRTKVAARNKKIRRSCLVSFIKSLGLTQEELEEKIRKLKYSRDYSFLFSHHDDDEQTDEKIKPYFGREKVEAFDDNKRLIKDVGAQEYVHRVVKQSNNRRMSTESRKAEDLKQVFFGASCAPRKCLAKIAHHRTHEMPCKYRRGREGRTELGHM